MALTIAFTDDNGVWGDNRVRRGTITGPSSYTAAGEPYDADDFLLNEISDLFIFNAVAGTDGRTVVNDVENSKLIYLTPAAVADTEAWEYEAVATSSDQDDVVVQFLVVGN